MIDSKDVLLDAEKNLITMKNHIFDVLQISPPVSEEYAIFLSKINSKLSSIVGNMIEEKMTTHLNSSGSYSNVGSWVRQDPGFPDNIFLSDEVPSIPGIEVKAWFPFATEITGRFKATQKLLSNNSIVVALVAWAPESILHGKPKILDVCIESGLQIAKDRDNHYFNPPYYLIVEPQDTSLRTANLQQQNVEGYRFQGTDDELLQAIEIVQNSGINRHIYDFNNPDIISLIQDLRNKFTYRLDTNFAKINRIQNSAINKFKHSVYNSTLHGEQILTWRKISRDPSILKKYLNLFPIKEELS